MLAMGAPERLRHHGVERLTDPATAPDLKFVSLSPLVLEPVAVRGLFGAIAADRHAAPSSCLHPRMVGKYQGAPMSFTSFHAGEIFFTHELGQCSANRQQ